MWACSLLLLIFGILTQAGTPTGKASTGKASAPTQGKALALPPTNRPLSSVNLAAAQAAALGAAQMAALGRPSNSNNKNTAAAIAAAAPPGDYDYDYPPSTKGKAPTGKASQGGQAGGGAQASGGTQAGGKAPTPAQGGGAGGKSSARPPTGKAGPKSNIAASQAAVLKPVNQTVAVGPNDYDYDYTTNSNGQKVPKCICAHEWEPVCGNVVQQGISTRVTFSNKCQGLCRTSTIVSGVCPGDSPVFEKCNFDNCQADDVNPICVYNTDFPNPCTANCQLSVFGEPPPPLDVMYSGPCNSDCLTNKTACPANRICYPKPGKCFQPPCYNYKCIDPTCANPAKCGDKFDLVCAQGITFTNECWANCEGYTSGIRKGVCPEGGRDPWFPHVIPHDPVARGLPDPLARPTPAVVVLKCVPGLYLNNSACVPCASGYSSQPAATQCEPCPPGSYAPARASPQCLPCPNGTFTSTIGSSTCQACTPPFITLRSGSVTCTLPPFSVYGRSTDCNVPDPCLCAQLVGDCGWSSSYGKCMKDKDTDCKECTKMSICRDSVNATDLTHTPPAVRDLAITDTQPQMLKVQWVQPIKNFICNVDMYKVQLQKEDGPWQLIEWPSFGIYGLDPVISIGGLTPSTGYTVKVVPVSLAGGDGPDTQIPARTASI